MPSITSFQNEIREEERNIDYYTDVYNTKNKSKLKELGLNNFETLKELIDESNRNIRRCRLTLSIPVLT